MPRNPDASTSRGPRDSGLRDQTAFQCTAQCPPSSPFAEICLCSFRLDGFRASSQINSEQKQLDGGHTPRGGLEGGRGDCPLGGMGQPPTHTTARFLDRWSVYLLISTVLLFLFFLWWI